MFRNIGKKEDYAEITHFGNDFYRVEWDYEPIKINSYGSEDSDVETIDDDTYASWMQETFKRKPELDEIKSMVFSYFDEKTENKIINGFEWTGRNGEVVKLFLTHENRHIYKDEYELAVQTNGSSLPFTFGYGDDSEPLYYEITTVEEFSNFYSSITNYIDTCTSEGESEKDGIDWSKYQID